MAKEFQFSTENPERARRDYLGYSGNQSEHSIRFILPTHRVGHIIRADTVFSCFVLSERLPDFNFASQLSMDLKEFGGNFFSNYQIEKKRYTRFLYTLIFQ